MKVVLNQDIKGVGKQGEIVNVAEGYARNYLFPRKMAVQATDAKLAEIAKARKAEEAHEKKMAEEAKATAARLSEAQVTVKGKVGTGTKLYGSITPADIADAIQKQTGIKVDKRKIEMEEPIKTLGTHEVPIRLHREATAHVKVEVVGD